MSDSNKNSNSSNDQKQLSDDLSTDNVNKEQEQLESRRKVLKNMLIGGGAIAGAKFLPDKWVQPIVNTVVTPAHAATSPLPTTAPPTTAAPGSTSTSTSTSTATA